MAVPNQTLTITQMYALARKAGLGMGEAVIAAAVGAAESSGRNWITSPNPDGGTNVGIWQLDTPGGKGTGYTVAQLQDPWTNAQVMAAGTGKGKDWSAWQTYMDGTYQQFMVTASTAQLTEGQHFGPARQSWIDSVINSIHSDWNKAVKTAEKAAGAAGSVFSWPSQITGFFDDAGRFVHAALWLVNPANWVRIIAGVFGVLLAGAGIIMLARAA